MSSPLVTVIIPAFNRAVYIDQTVRCVLEQTYTNVEIIVVDDGSTDGTYEKLQAYENRLILLTHAQHQNKGQSASINIGLQRASGQYIAILDSDDYWELNKLAVQVDYLERHPHVGLLYTNGYAVDADGHRLYQIHQDDHVERNDPDGVLLDCYIALPVNSLIRKSVYDQVGGFNEQYRAAQDHDMLVRVAEVTEFAYLPDYLWYYRQHDGSISSTRQGARWRYGFMILNEAKSRYPYRASTVRKRLAVLHYRMGMCCRSERQLMKAFWHLFNAFIMDPVRATKVVLGIEKKT